MATETTDVMTLEQAADYLRLPVDETARLFEEGRLPAARIGDRYWRIQASVLDEWLRTAAYRNLVEARKAKGRRALERLEAVREQILRRRDGVPFPGGYGAEVIREEET
ncbi:MAG: helix-turn-helix domain-containing protein [candidate division WS1 bacterium]|nr:helix-turn-helix domain-containing protein [candidate division WS1 bacterium]